ncbi:ferredoxin family protein [Arcanobacterium ihumii]|uniref:ferredoxin family protein n=1 Tax=Arcanobacterium ihumii TaxID=2138162 RepID=UPI000F527595|nr:4Fe-4S dicluster domain-containing protein [Arcanobacterium ihumii]
MENRLAQTHFELDDEYGHIEVNQEAVREAGIGDALINVCPANVYSRMANGDIDAEYAACLECGSCRQITPEGTLTWHYPRGGFGVRFLQG